MLPMPTPAPIRAEQARPAPIIFAAASSISKSPFQFASCVGYFCSRPTACSVLHVHGIVEIDAGEHGDDERLQESHEELEAGEGDHKPCRCNLAPPGQHHGEAGEHFE